MEASKCPKCGEEPQYIEHMEKWYCYGCNTYVECEEEHVCASEKTAEKCAEKIAEELKSLDEEEMLACKKCGAELEDLKDGKLYCFVCETYQDEVGATEPDVAHETPSVEKHPENEVKPINEAQQLLELQEPHHELEGSAKPSVLSVELKSALQEAAIPLEPVIDRADESIPTPVPETPMGPSIEKAAPVKICATCGNPLKWIEKYQRDYCYSCRKYAPKEAAAIHMASDKKKCPGCGGELKYVEKYAEWYCHACKKYPLRAQKKPGEVRRGPLVCPRCKGQVKWVDKYARFYCYKCKEYAPKGFGGVPSHPGQKMTCPTCNQTMRFIHEYNEWYCYKCKKYSLRPNKPVLLF